MSGSQEKRVEALKHIARFAKLENGHLTVKFDEIGALSFGLKIPEILPKVGFQNCALDVLVAFCSGLKEVFESLLWPNSTITGKEFEILARILLGFQAVVIFGVKAITPSIKQVSVTVSTCRDKGQTSVGSKQDCMENNKTKVV